MYICDYFYQMKSLISKPFFLRTNKMFSPPDLQKVCMHVILDLLDTQIGNMYNRSPTCTVLTLMLVLIQAFKPNNKYSCTNENHTIQHTKSVVLKYGSPTKDTDFNFKIKFSALEQPYSAKHFGIKHSSNKPKARIYASKN